MNYLGDSRIDDPSKKTELFYTGNSHEVPDPLFGGNNNREISGVIYSEIDHDISQAKNVDKMTLYRNVNPINAPDLCLRGYPWMTAYNKDRIEFENDRLSKTTTFDSGKMFNFQYRYSGEAQNSIMPISFNKPIEYNRRHQERTST